MIVTIGSMLGGCVLYVAAMSALGRYLAHRAADELDAAMTAPEAPARPAPAPAAATAHAATPHAPPS